MLSTSFKCEYQKEAITKVSIISEQDSFIYGIFCNHSLVEAGRLSPSDIYSFFIEYKDFPTHYSSKSRAFSHVDEGNIAALRSQTKYSELIDTNPNVYCCFFDDNYKSLSITPQHFSTILHHHYKYKGDKIGYIHFNKTSIIICITGSEGFKFYNEFDYETSTDALYYILAVLEKVEITHEEIKIFAGGYIDSDSELEKTLSKYLTHFELVNIEKLIVQNDDTNPHCYFDHYLNINA
jgi:hypothetical protein